MMKYGGQKFLKLLSFSFNRHIRLGIYFAITKKKLTLWQSTQKEHKKRSRKQCAKESVGHYKVGGAVKK